MNHPSGISPGPLSLSRWNPPSDPVRFYALLGCLEPDGLIRKCLSSDGHWWLQKVAMQLWDEENGGEPVDRHFMKEAAQQITSDLHKQMLRGFSWYLPPLGRPTLRDSLGLDVPAMWGIVSLR